VEFLQSLILAERLWQISIAAARHPLNIYLEGLNALIKTKYLKEHVGEGLIRWPSYYQMSDDLWSLNEFHHLLKLINVFSLEIKEKTKSNVIVKSETSFLGWFFVALNFLKYWYLFDGSDINVEGLWT
jgi:hypothetical protein